MSAATPAVLFVSLPAGRGGSVESLLSVLAGLDGRCHRIVARPAGTRVASNLADERLADATVDLPRPRTRASRLRSCLLLARAVRRARPDLAAIHANGLSELLICLPAAILGRRPVVVWVHDWQVSARQSRVARLVAPLAAIRWLTVSEANRDALEADGVSGGAPIGVVPNPVEAPDRPPTPTRGPPGSDPAATTVGYLGAPAAYKGFDLLPAVVDRVATLAPEIRWDIWSGPREQESAVFEALEGHPQVTVHPKTDDVASAYRSADIVFCPSRRRVLRSGRGRGARPRETARRERPAGPPGGGRRRRRAGPARRRRGRGRRDRRPRRRP